MFWRNAPAKAASPRAARYWSLARRLTWLYTGATALLLVLACAYLYWTQVANLAREDNAFLVNKIRDCRRLLASAWKPGSLPAYRTVLCKPRRIVEFRPRPPAIARFAAANSRRHPRPAVALLR